MGIAGYHKNCGGASSRDINEIQRGKFITCVGLGIWRFIFYLLIVLLNFKFGLHHSLELKTFFSQHHFYVLSNLTPVTIHSLFGRSCWVCSAIILA